MRVGGKSVLVIAGEISGDMHAAKLIREVQEKDPSVSFWGIGGDEMEALGVACEYHVRDMAVLGLAEVLRRYGWFHKVFHHMLALAAERRPDVVLLVDYPGFNLRFAKQIKRRLGTTIAYYISPQVWAWKASRIPKIAATVDRLMVIFPFEVDSFRHHVGETFRVDYVGHPLAEGVREARARVRAALPWGEGDGVKLAVLPGSRAQEVERILPTLVAALRQLPEGLVRPIIAAASPELAPRVRDLADGLTVVEGMTREILLQADYGLVASGTATLEAALCHCPMAIVYRTSALTYAVGKRVVKLPYIGLANIVAGREAFQEFLQDEATPEAIAAHVRKVLGTEGLLSELSEATRVVDAKISDAEGSANASGILLDAMQ